jgi:hypothetical protein
MLQLCHIVQGDTSLLCSLGLEATWAFDETDTFIPFQIQCTDAVGNVAGLLQRMINVLAATVNPRSIRGSRH